MNCVRMRTERRLPLVFRSRVPAITNIFNDLPVQRRAILGSARAKQKKGQAKVRGEKKGKV